MTGRVFVVGSVNMDVITTSPRLPDPGETVQGTSLKLLPGGKGANQAVAASRLGADTLLVGCVGLDAWSDELLRFLSAEGVDISRVRRTSEVTGTAIVMVADSGENAIVVTPGANQELTPADLEALPWGAKDVMITQCEIPHETSYAALVAARRAGVFTLLNPSPMVSEVAALVPMADVVVLNESELAALGDTSIRAKGQLLVLTLGARGAMLIDDTGETTLPAPEVDVVDTTGAGDCFLGVLAASLAAESLPAEAVQLAITAASLSVQVPGAGPSMPTITQVRAAFIG